MHIPKVDFIPLTLEENIDLIKWAYFVDNGSLDVHSYTLNYFPKLKEIPKNSTKEEIYLIIEEVVTNEYALYKDKILSEVERYNKIWESYNDTYLEALSKYLNVDWPDSVKIINGFVGLMPVFPRYLDTFDFSIAIDVNKNEVIKSTAHETCHFLWFTKWKELYPDCPRRHYDSPYNPWQYSEMVVDPILNSNEINSVISIKEKAYDSFYEIVDSNGKYLMDVLNEIYKSNDCIEDKIKSGYDYICSVLEDNEVS